MDASRSRWRFSQRMGWAIAALSCFASMGCATLPAAERTALIEASAQYSRGDTAAAVTCLDRLIRDYSQTSEIAEAYYVRGLCRFRQRQHRAASEDFERAISKSGRRELTAHARASLAAVAYLEANWTRAARLYGEALPELPDTPPTDEALYSAGIAMRRAGQWRDAALQFSRLLRTFRERPIAADARRMAGWRHPFFSIQLGAFRNADNAAKQVRYFRQQGLSDAMQENLPRNGAAMWVVRTGQYQTYADARGALLRVQRVQPDAVIIP